MIRSFRSRALDTFWNDGDTKAIRPDLLESLKVRLSRLDAATQPEEVNAAGFNFHRLRGKPVRYTVYINGPWCLTFGWDGEGAVRVDLEQYH
jgi:proteic killer suppression protein